MLSDFTWNLYTITPNIGPPAYKHMCLYPDDIYESVKVIEVYNYRNTIDFIANYCRSDDVFIRLQYLSPTHV